MSTPTIAGGRRGPAWASSPAVRRLATCLAIGAVVALMTGKNGSNQAPTAGFTGTFTSVHAYFWIIAGVVLWAAMTLWQSRGEAIKRTYTGLTAKPRHVLGQRRVKYPVYLLCLVAALVVPNWVNGFWQEVLVGQIAPYVLLAIGLNVVVGFAGLLDLGYIAFYAVGAYSAAYWTNQLPAHPPFTVNVFWTIPLAILAAMIAGVILGAPTLRLRGDYLAIVTLGFGEIIQLVANNSKSITNGSEGVAPNSVPDFSIHTAGIHYTWPLETLPGNHMPWYYLILGLIVVVVVAFHLLENSRVGRVWVAIREDEVAAEACGINPLKYKVMAFAIGASTSGIAGVFFASKTGVFDPSSFPFQQSVLVLVLVIFGGMGSIPGAIIGAALLQYLPQLLRSHIQQPDLYAYYGAILIAMMIFRPQGVVPSRRRAREIAQAEAGVGGADALAAPGAAP
ncbi:MAG TPA: branched-chain amino acid ABC transporter permease [Mycobacteriales bacterium]|nr:branched-chain amino acid ABC transporter permease [Mycobacteriales bacterium]